VTTNPMGSPCIQLKSQVLAQSASVEHPFREILLQNELTQVPAQSLSLVHEDELSFEVQLPVTCATMECDTPIGFNAEAGDSVTDGEAQEEANALDGLSAVSTSSAVRKEALTTKVLRDPDSFMDTPEKWFMESPQLRCESEVGARAGEPR
jgi:hypothetical protein